MLGRSCLEQPIVSSLVPYLIFLTPFHPLSSCCWTVDEFAQAKGDHPWGFSALGGQMHSIYGSGSSDIAVREGYSDVCGSSGGSALSVALGLASFSLGTQTGVSIVCPAGRAGVVGFKPGRGGMMPMEGVSKLNPSRTPPARGINSHRLLIPI